MSVEFVVALVKLLAARSLELPSHVRFIADGCEYVYVPATRDLLYYSNGNQTRTSCSHSVLYRARRGSVQDVQTAIDSHKNPETLRSTLLGLREAVRMS